MILIDKSEKNTWNIAEFRGRKLLDWNTLNNSFEDREEQEEIEL